MAVVQNPLFWGTQEYFGGNNGNAPIHGISTSFAWTSDVVDLQSAIGASLNLQFPTGATQAQLVVPSATSGLGLLFTANATGTGGNSIEITVASPAGSTSSVVTATDSIVISPSTTATNGSIMALINSDPNASPLVTASLFGWMNDGDSITSFNEDPMEFDRVDLMAAMSITHLAGGAATSSPVGTLQVWGSNLLYPDSFCHLSNYDVTVSGTGPSITALSDLYVRYLQTRWVPDPGGSTGRVYAMWMGKGNPHL